MTWVKLDDGFWGNPRVVTVGNEAAGVFARMLSYCGCHETDGFVPEEIARFIAKSRLFEKLEQGKLIEPIEGGWLIPDFLDFNPSHAVLEAKRAKDRERKSTGNP